MQRTSVDMARRTWRGCRWAERFGWANEEMNRDSARIAMARYFELPAARFLGALGATPTMVTVAGLAVAGAAAYLVSEEMLLAGGLVLAASGLLDMLDGALARLSQRETKFGALLDSTADRVAEVGIFLALALLLSREGESIGVALCLAALGGSMMVSYIRARGESLGVTASGGMMARPERVVSLAIGLVVAEWWLPAATITLAAVAGLTTLTSAQRIWHLRGGLENRG